MDIIPGLSLKISSPFHNLGTSLKIFVIIALVLLQISLNHSITKIFSKIDSLSADEGHRLDPNLSRIISFGNTPTLVDTLTIRVLGNPGEGKVPKSVHPAIYFYLELIRDLDPLFSEINPLANMLAVLRGDALGARDLLEKSQIFVKNELYKYPTSFQRKFWLAPWQGQLFLAFVNIFELDDLPRAAKAFKEAAAMPGSPPYLQRLEKKLASPGGEYEVGLKLLEFLIRGARDENYKASLESRLANLRIAFFLDSTNRAFKKFIAKHSSLNSKNRLTAQKANQLWSTFLIQTAHSPVDPWNGRLSLDQNNKVVTTTPYKKVFALE